MQIIMTKNYQEMSRKAAEYLISKVRANPSMTLGLATGGTPIGLYEQLIRDHRDNGTSYENITTFNLDEYIGLKPENEHSYHYYMNENFFKHINIPISNTHIPNGLADHKEDECNRYEKLIQENGGIDVQVLGIGGNGHIGFNEPGTPFSSTTHIINLAQATREANARFFNSIDEVPTQAITMGIKTIMQSKEIVLLASGKAKKEAIKKLFSQEVTESFPASILNLHPNVIIFVDEEALPETVLESVKGA
ncbi:glucosamine-6-phosphate deaminase [Bacillus sp. FJAT-47783]|uniref:glucosamine-6-phosphate deaminase n=1 Tax=Bacillus sp. FJAT-47783 TaxID=2922712 RepID=UPI001FAD2DE0|nr:glucosamine-6-phosphate deaminase [Bacillus sp. FJAT-47783]